MTNPCSFENATFIVERNAWNYVAKLISGFSKKGVYIKFLWVNLEE
ncbi:hypothetical protein SAMN04244574_04700 [Azotobacter beijerinckii]|uniref:Uncharacterized protein n=1 Tax=Azotobacter beijerinckii TaxID=170623 RepID=A0A1I4IWF0_9GAMM|nr:hypothetical protein SAMN04244571_04808 [Azotobacter beijerinckii]SFL58181.1 hypothetical protein SAMN04244574_04700 [Azotobacter beijerinckii]